jgi:hypothetical protein
MTMFAKASPREDASMTLERETETFQRELPNLLNLVSDQQKRGKFALVYGDKVDSIWPNLDDVITAGYERCGIEPFLVKEIVEHEKPVYFSRNLKRCR